MSMIVPGDVSPFMAALGGDPLDQIMRVDRSVRFNSPDSASLGRTPASQGSLTAWTWSGWIKRSILFSGGSKSLFAATSSGTNYCVLAFDADQLYFVNRPPAGINALKRTNALFRDVSSHIHVVAVWDSANATAADRMRLSVNGVRLTSFSASTDPTSSLASILNTTIAHYNGNDGLTNNFDGYLSEVNFIDGQALDPTSFGMFHPLTGQWRPKKYTGTYGANGYRLDFSDNSAATAAALGADRSGNGNNWTPTNISVAAGSGNDSSLDTPTNVFPTFNPLHDAGNSPSFANGNLEVSIATSASTILSTIETGTSGKWYVEFQHTTITDAQSGCGIHGLAYRANAKKLDGVTSYGATYTTSDIIGAAVNCAANTVEFFKNNVSQGVQTGGSSSSAFALLVSSSGLSACVINFGQRAFVYTPPSGFKALCTKNLPYPAISRPKQYFDAAVYTGNGAARSISVDGNGNNLEFMPDLVWVKSRSAATDHKITDSVRGTTKALESNTTDAEATEAQGLTAFNSNGFGLGTDSNYNANAGSFVAWLWKGGGAPVTNNAGSIASQVSANVAAGMSVVTYTGTGANATVGHGLGVAPKMVVVKDRSNATTWPVWHTGLGASDVVFLETTGGLFSSPTCFNGTYPTSSVVSLGTNGATNSLSDSYVAYVFADVAGFSKFGTYNGNGSTDGPFVNCGFRPKYLLIKYLAGGGNANWVLHDAVRDIYNPEGNTLLQNKVDTELTANNYVDFCSNGFKVRGAAGDTNISSGAYIFAAFAEFPFRYANAR